MSRLKQVIFSISLVFTSSQVLMAQDHIIFVDISDIENVANVKSKLLSLTDSLEYYNRPFVLLIHNSPESIVSNDSKDYRKAIGNIMFIDPSVPSPFETIWLIDSATISNKIGKHENIHFHIFSSYRNLESNYLRKRMINSLILTLTKQPGDIDEQPEVIYYFPSRDREMGNREGEQSYKNKIFY